jgi:hypothetical protein
MARGLTLSRGAWSQDLASVDYGAFPSSGGMFLGANASIFGAPTATIDEQLLIVTPGAIQTPITHRPRDLVVPVLLQGAAPGDLETIIAALSTGTDPIYDSDPVRLTWERDDSSSRWIDARLIGGGAGLSVRHVGSLSARAVLAFRAAWPYWSDGADRTVTTTNADFAGRGTLFSAVGVAFSAAGEPFSGESVATETATITGDLAAQPIWQADGPFEQLDAVRADGAAWRYTGTVLAGETLTIDTRPTSRSATLDGASVWANLAGSSTMFGFEPGAASWLVNAKGHGVGTEIRMSWRPSWLAC